jgi:hypothetical protein
MLLERLVADVEDLRNDMRQLATEVRALRSGGGPELPNEHTAHKPW